LVDEDHGTGLLSAVEVGAYSTEQEHVLLDHASLDEARLVRVHEGLDDAVQAESEHLGQDL